MLPSLLSCLSSADPSLGKVDTSNLPQQSHMELFVAQLSSFYRDHPRSDHPLRVPDSPDYKDIAQWRGLRLNPQGEVTEIEWYNYHNLSIERLDFRWVPPTVQSLQIHGLEEIQGTLETSDLPHSLVDVRIQYVHLVGTISFAGFPPNIDRWLIMECQFSGTLSWGDLPHKIECLGIGCNNFSGTVDLLKLPPSLTELGVQFNAFSGQLNVPDCPETLKIIHFRNNLFEGTLYLSKVNALKQPIVHRVGYVHRIKFDEENFTSVAWASIPSHLMYVELTNGHLEGSLHLSELPRVFAGLDVDSNNFSGSIFLRDLPPTMHILRASSNTLSGELFFDGVPDHMKVLDLASNAFFGTIDTSMLPKGLEILDLRENQFYGPIALEQLPTNLEYLLLSDNRIEQDCVTFGDLPKGLRCIELLGNSIRGYTASKDYQKIVEFDKGVVRVEEKSQENGKEDKVITGKANGKKRCSVM